MAHVLKAKTNRKGEVKRFDVVALSDDSATVSETVKDLPEGSYTVHAAGKVVTADISYRTVQDVKLS